MDWNAYTERHRRRDRIIVAALCTGVVASLAVLAACASILARVS